MKRRDVSSTLSRCNSFLLLCPTQKTRGVRFEETRLGYVEKSNFESTYATCLIVRSSALSAVKLFMMLTA